MPIFRSKGTCYTKAAAKLFAMIKFSDLVSQVVQLIRKDKIVLAPYLICVFLTSLLDQHWLPLLEKKLGMYEYLTRFLLTHWIVDLFFMGVTVSIAVSLYHNRKIIIGNSVAEVRKKFFHLMLGTIVTVMPMALVSYKMSVGYQETKSIEFWVLGLAFILVPVIVCLMFVPVLVVVKDLKWFQSIIQSFYFVKRHLKNVLFFVSMVFCINVLSLSLGAMMMVIPVVGKSVFFVACQGFGYSVIYILTVVFYMECSKEGSIAVKV